MKSKVGQAKTYSAGTAHTVHAALKQAPDQAVRTNLFPRDPGADTHRTLH